MSRQFKIPFCTVFPGDPPMAGFYLPNIDGGRSNIGSPGMTAAEIRVWIDRLQEIQRELDVLEVRKETK